MRDSSLLPATLAVVPAVPVAGLALILGIDRFMSEARSMTNFIGNGVATIVVSKWERELDMKALKHELQGIAQMAAAIWGSLTESSGLCDARDGSSTFYAKTRPSYDGRRETGGFMQIPRVIPILLFLHAAVVVAQTPQHTVRIHGSTMRWATKSTPTGHQKSRPAANGRGDVERRGRPGRERLDLQSRQDSGASLFTRRANS